MNVNLSAPINDLGYGVVGKNVLKGLIKNGVSVSYWPIGQATVRDVETGEAVKRSMLKCQDFNYRAPSLRIWHQHDMAQHIGGGKRIGFPIFELNRFSEIEKHHLSSLDGIVVCSKWAKEIVEKEVPSLKYKICVAPLGVDTEIFENHAHEKENEKTVFLNVGKWEIRKGHDILADAFSKAFTKSDKVELWMMNHNPFLNEKQEKEWHNLYLNSSLGEKIKIIPRGETQNDVAAVMSQADVGVFPSRAEGWNLEALEMMSMGKYVILTNYSAHTEFATDINSKLINIDETEDAYDGIWFNGQGEWASIGDKQIEQLIFHMRTLHELKQKEYKENRANKNERGIITGKEFSWDNCSNEIIKYLSMMEGF